MRFEDSQDHVGLQLADVCATIVRRFLVDGWEKPYRLLKPRILRDDREVRIALVALDETSLREGPPEEGVRIWSAPDFHEEGTTPKGEDNEAT